MWTTFFGKYLGTIAAVATIAVVSGSATHLWQYNVLAGAVAANTEAITTEDQGAKEERQDIKDALAKILDQQTTIMTKQSQMEGLILTPEVQGRGTVGDFGFESSFVDINEYGKANMYLKAENVSITAPDLEGVQHTAEFRVRGSLRNRNDNGHLIMFSILAADELGVEGIVDRVTVGPVKR